MLRERRTVVYGDGTTASIVPEGPGSTTPWASGSTSGSFNKLGPVIKSLTTIDTGGHRPGGHGHPRRVHHPGRGVHGLRHGHDRRRPRRSPTSASTLDSNQGNVRAVVTLNQLHVPLAVTARIFGIPSNCALNVDADSVTIDGNYALSPDPVDPHNLDVNLVGATPVGHRQRGRQRLHQRHLLDPGDRADRRAAAARRGGAAGDQPDHAARRPRRHRPGRLAGGRRRRGRAGPGQHRRPDRRVARPRPSTRRSPPPTRTPTASASGPPRCSARPASCPARPTCPARSPSATPSTRSAPRPRRVRPSTWASAPRSPASTSCWRARPSVACSTST